MQVLNFILEKRDRIIPCSLIGSFAISSRNCIVCAIESLVSSIHRNAHGYRFYSVLAGLLLRKSCAALRSVHCSQKESISTRHHFCSPDHGHLWLLRMDSAEPEQTPYAAISEQSSKWARVSFETTVTIHRWLRTNKYLLEPAIPIIPR